MTELRIALAIRESSVIAARRLGVEIASSLPLLDADWRLRPSSEVVDRLLCLLAVAASAHGFDSRKARAWLKEEHLLDTLTPSEREFLSEGDNSGAQFIVQVEAMWALAWALGLVAGLDFTQSCASNFVSMLTNLKTSERSDKLRAQEKLRSLSEVVSACDLAYCLHWAQREAEQTGTKPALPVEAFVVEERRRALEWLINDEPWTVASLDT